MRRGNLIRYALRFLSVLTLVCFVGVLYVFLHSYYLCSYRTVKNFGDPRWRVFDYNSRQASENDIYAVAEIPVLKHARLAGERLMRFEFEPPIEAESWTAIAVSDGRVVNRGKYPEIQFPDHESNETYLLKPEGVKLLKDIVFRIDFWPKEKYRPHHLSWPDNYWLETSSIPVGLRRPYSVDEWVGLPGDDPEVVEARGILGDTVDYDAPTLTKIEQVYRFVTRNTNFAHLIPSDEIQAASPLETYRMMHEGKGQGWCEDHAVVYYLFANAAGVKTRLVDVAGKLGPLKLTGHYFCESWVPEHGTWAYVDPETFIAYITDADGVPVTTLGLRRLNECRAFDSHTACVYDMENDAFVKKTGEELREHLVDNFLENILQKDAVFAYKFGYGAARSFSKVKNFLRYTTLLYAPFTLSRLYLVKYVFLYGFVVSLACTILLGVLSRVV